MSLEREQAELMALRFVCWHDVVIFHPAGGLRSMRRSSVKHCAQRRDRITMRPPLKPVKTNVVTYYRVLGVARTASISEIRDAFRRRAHSTHPDKGGDPEVFMLVQEAYAVLSDAERRVEYDAFLKSTPNDDPSRAGCQDEANAPSQEPNSSGSTTAYTREPAGWGWIVALGAIAWLCFVLGDRKGADYNGFVVFAGWIVAAAAVAARKIGFRKRDKTEGAAPMKRFAIGALRIAAGLSIAILIVVGAVWAFYAQQEASQKATDAPLAVKKDWGTLTADGLGGARFSVATKWQDARIYYQVTVEGFPPIIANARDTSPNSTFTLGFFDKDGFKTFVKQIDLHEMIAATGADGVRTGLSWNGDDYLLADLYRNSTQWNLAWAGFQPVRTPPHRNVALPAATWRDRASWRRLANGMSGAAVRELLGDPTRINVFGSAGAFWYYGDTAYVSMSAAGMVDGWMEP
jgi:hypothetical protein